jgi:hypothetical protein
MRTRNGVIAVAVLSAVAFAGSIRAEHQVAVQVAHQAQADHVSVLKVEGMT